MQVHCLEGWPFPHCPPEPHLRSDPPCMRPGIFAHALDPPLGSFGLSASTEFDDGQDGGISFLLLLYLATPLSSV